MAPATPINTAERPDAGSNRDAAPAAAGNRIRVASPASQNRQPTAVTGETASNACAKSTAGARRDATD